MVFSGDSSVFMFCHDLPVLHAHDFCCCGDVAYCFDACNMPSCCFGQIVVMSCIVYVLNRCSVLTVLYMKLA